MSTNARNGWNAAQRAAERELPKPREILVGVRLSPLGFADRRTPDSTCKACGFQFHKPTCPTQQRPEPVSLPQFVIVNGATMTVEEFNQKARAAEDRASFRALPVGSWLWAKAQMQDGQVVKHGFRTVRFSGERFETFLAGQWRRTKEDVFRGTVGWQLVDVDPR